MRALRPRTVLPISIVLALTCAGALSSCSALSNRSDHQWKTASAMSGSAQSATVPSLVAADATNIRLSTAEIGGGPTVLAWDSDSGITREDCRRTSLEGAPASSVPKWWPKRTPDEGWSCGWWRVFQQDGGYYSWRQQGRAE